MNMLPSSPEYRDALARCEKLPVNGCCSCGAFCRDLKSALATIAELTDKLEANKQERIYYQDIVYSVCCALDRIHGRKVSLGQGIVCGTSDTPSDAVQKEMKTLETTIAELQKRVEGLEKALERLAFHEQEYRRSHDLNGGGDLETGRQWDLMRRAGKEARALLTPAANPSAEKGG